MLYMLISIKRVLPYLLYVFVTISVSSCKNTQNKDIVFTDNYPPIAEVPYNINGKVYNVQAFEGQCVVFFDDVVPYSQVKDIIRQSEGEIIEQIPVFNYYLVRVSAGSESEFVIKMRERQDVLFSFFNTPYTLSAYVYILDGFKVQDKKLLISHGNAVKRMFSKYGFGKSIYCVDLSQLGGIHSIGDFFVRPIKIMAGNSACGELLRIAKNAKTDDIVLINMSFGTPLYGKSKERDLISDVDERYRDVYKIEYAESLKSLAICLTKMREKGLLNFIITKASGNEGYHKLDDVLDSFDETTLSSLKRNLILVSACDRKTDIWYSNLPVGKHQLCTTIDISNEDLFGTSFAAPKLLGFIDKIMTAHKPLNAQDMLQAIRAATPINPHEPMTYEMLEKEAVKLVGRQCNRYTFTLNMTYDHSGEWKLYDDTCESIVKYCVHDTYSQYYLSGYVRAIEIDNTSNKGIDVLLNSVEPEKGIQPMRYYLAPGERQSFYAYNCGTLEIISIMKMEVTITTW